MVSSVLLSLALLAHGADPRPISADEATANLVKFFVTIALALIMIVPVLAPLFRSDSEGPESATSPGADPKNLSLVGWVGLGLMVILSMAWWLTRTSFVELTTPEADMPEHVHTQERGGQIAMWADFHAEVSRIESGEVRIHLTDSYSRPIAARFFQAEIEPLASEVGTDATPDPSASATPQPRASATPTSSSGGASSLGPAAKEALASLNDTYRFVQMPRETKKYRIKVSTPGWSVTLKFEFDEGKGRRSLPIWCGANP